jgi:CubicO group peptidase (beta-lactamase class C family)
MPVDPATTMMAYSMSKTITAAAVLQLVQTGRVELDDPVERYIEPLPYGSSVTVGQLVSHTSGIPNPIPLRWVHPAERHATFDENAALTAVLHDHPRLSFEPGTKYQYSNIGYWLLGKVVERASRETFSSYVVNRVLRPLAIESEEMGYVVADPAHHATGYLEKFSLMNLAKHFLIDRELFGGYSGRWLEIRSHYLNGLAFGGLVGAASGFGQFLQDQLRARSVLFNDNTRQLFYTQQRTARGSAVPMTLGWHIGAVDGAPFFYKEGGGGGFHSMMRLYPAAGIGTVVMTNATGLMLLNRAADRFLAASSRSILGSLPSAAFLRSRSTNSSESATSSVSSTCPTSRVSSVVQAMPAVEAARVAMASHWPARNSYSSAVAWSRITGYLPCPRSPRLVKS